MRLPEGEEKEKIYAKLYFHCVFAHLFICVSVAHYVFVCKQAGGGVSGGGEGGEGGKGDGGERMKYEG